VAGTITIHDVREIPGNRSSLRAHGGQPPSAWLFLAVFAAVVLSFVGATSYERYLEQAIHSLAEEITADATPSIEHLSEARSELRHVQALVQGLALSKGEGRLARDEDEIARARRVFRAETDAYLALPLFAGERGHWEEVVADIDTVNQLCDRILDAVAHGDPGASDLAILQLEPAADRAAEALGRSVTFNAREARALAQRIDVTRRRAANLAGALDALSAVLALIACLGLYRVVRRHATLLDENRRLTEARAAELDLFAGRVAHDIMSPLGAATLALSMANRSLPDEHQAKAFLARGQRSLQSLQRLVDGLLDLARAGSRPCPDARAEVRPVLDEVIAEARPAAVEAGIEVRVDPFEPCAVACAEGVLASLVSNLVRNAVKYMGRCPERRVTVRVHARPEAVRIEVADTGPGIPEALHATIFEPYVRGSGSDKPGIGLGLATVKRIVDAHRGKLALTSSPGRGSVFRIDLPRAGGAVREAG
jgi:signal transduction histidine kinase